MPFVYVKCSTCHANVLADADQAGQVVPCQRCGQPATVVSARLTVRPAARRGEAGGPSRFFTGSSMLRVWLVALLLAAGAWASRALSDSTPAAPAVPAAQSAADERQFAILRDAITLPADPALVAVYDDLNRRHFHALLPKIPVLWEPRLAEVGRLADDAFSLEGMFGHIGDRAVILLNPDLARDAEAIRRALSHEMVHAWLYSIGEASTGHGPAFQVALKRLAAEGAFTGLPASERERDALREWLDAESSRLDSLRDQARREGDRLSTEARDLDRDLAALAGRGVDPASTDPSIVAWRSRRDSYNRRVEQLRDRAAKHEQEVAAFNEQVERYNLMAAYPHGLDEPSAPAASTR